MFHIEIGVHVLHRDRSTCSIQRQEYIFYIEKGVHVLNRYRSNCSIKRQEYIFYIEIGVRGSPQRLRFRSSWFSVEIQKSRNLGVHVLHREIRVHRYPQRGSSIWLSIERQQYMVIHREVVVHGYPQRGSSTWLSIERQQYMDIHREVVVRGYPQRSRLTTQSQTNSVQDFS